MSTQRFRRGHEFLELKDGQLVVRETFKSVNAAKRANRQFNYPTLPESAKVRAKRMMYNWGRS